MAARRAFAYSLTLRQVGPATDPAFAGAPRAVRDEVKRWIVVYGLKEKDADLAAGLDRHGAPLASISPATREDRRSEMGFADPDAPPLMPAYAVSRTRLLLEGEPTDDGARFWWGHDAYTGGPWGRILDYHRRGIGRRRVKRDVIGLSADAVSRVRRQVMARWTAWKATGLRPGWKPPAPVEAPPPRLVTVGDTAYDQYTYGIGGKGGAPGEGVQTTGFTQRRPGEGWTAFGGPGGPGGRGPGGRGPGGAGDVLSPSFSPPRPPAGAGPFSPPKPPVPTPRPGDVPKAAATTAGRRTGQSVEVRLGGVLGDHAREAVRAIDAVHHLPGLPVVPIQAMESPRPGHNGTYRRTRRNVPVRIEISEATTTPRLTTAHEIGHMVETAAVPGAKSEDGTRDWEKDEVMARWKAAVDASRAVRWLRSIRGKHVVVPRPDGTGEDRVKADVAHIDYLTRYDELWARSYAQYIATRGGSEAMKAEARSMLTTPTNIHGSQWADDDFGPIASAIDDLFRRLGWKS